MTPTRVVGAFALLLTLGGAAQAADAPAAAAPASPPDPVAGFLNPLLAPVSTILDPLGPIADNMAKPINAVLPQPAPTPAAEPAAPAPKHHRHHHHRHHRAA